MMSYSLKTPFKDRKNTFSDFWFEIVRTRFVLCIIVALFSLLTPNTPKLKYIFALIALYLAFNLSLGFLDSSKLQLKRVRVILPIIDVVFASFLIYFTGGQNSSWFLLYFFPIISVSRYLSYEGSVPLALLAIFFYGFLILTYSPSIDFYSLTLKAIVFLGIALIVGNLMRSKQRKADNLIEFFKEIDNAIFSDEETNKEMKLILEKALEFTGSELGYLRILNPEAGNTNISFAKDKDLQQEWQMEDFTERFYAKVIASKKPFSILSIKKKKGKYNLLSQEIQNKFKQLIYVYPAYAHDSENIPKSALFVPLILKKQVRAIIALYSKNRFHYSQSEAIKLGNFAYLLRVALRYSKMYQITIGSEKEKKERLKMLHEIAEQLKVEQGLSEIFQKVVDLTYNQLNSEEASLFILDEDNKDVVKKVAVKGPSEEITRKLERIEKPYQKGESLVGKIFQNKEHMHLLCVPSDVQFHDEYSKTLLSRKVYHFIGVPLIIGEEVLGVIRVINKRAADYSLENGIFGLSKTGFDAEDVELLQTIASQVASAIRSAKFIEVQRYYQELVENSPDPIIVLDEKGGIKVFNKACEKIWGFTANEVIGQPVTNYYESAELAKEMGKLLWSSPNNRVQDFQARIKDYKGEIIPISLSASRLFDKQGDGIGSIGVFKDLRETLKLEGEKARAEKLATLGKLAHTVGHEIKHDIATALNYIDVLAYECTDNEELSEIYRDVQEALSEAIDKFQNMLMVGRPKPHEKHLIGVGDIFQRVEASMRRRAHSKKIDFSITYPDEDYELEADVEQLRQVLLNLFDNSIDAIEAKKHSGRPTSEKGRIELSAQARNGDLRISWKDNGCGISTDNISNIFTPFVTYKPTGYGLGLFIVKTIIENHGGNVSVESEEGKGANFEIAIPLSRN
jgi:PAS domain S-box-containing protein